MILSARDARHELEDLENLKDLDREQQAFEDCLNENCFRIREAIRKHENNCKLCLYGYTVEGDLIMLDNQVRTAMEKLGYKLELQRKLESGKPHEYYKVSW